MDDRGKIRLFDFEKGDLYYFAFLLILTIWLFAPLLSPDRIMLPFPDTIYTDASEGIDANNKYTFPEGSDVNLEFQPWNYYATERIKEGEIPFWDPYNFCGTPFYANSLNQLTYIPRLILSIILPPQNVLSVLAMFHFLLAGIGFFYLLKAYRVGWLAASAASILILFKFSHPTALMMPPQSLTLAYAPICLLLAIKLIRGGRWLYALLLAICLSAVISSGYPSFTVHFAYLGAALVIFEIFRGNNYGAWSAKRIGPLLAAVVLGVLLSLAQLIPLWQFYSLSSRADYLTMFTGPKFNLQAFFLMIYQNILSPGDLALDSPGPLKFSNLYFGIVPFLFSLPIFGQWRNPVYRFFFFLVIILAIPLVSPWVLGKLMHIIPGMGFTPIPPMGPLFLSIAMAFGLTLDHIARKGKDCLPPISLLAVLLILLVLTPPSIWKHPMFIAGFSPDYIFYLIAIALLFSSLLLAQFGKGKMLPVLVVLVVIMINFLPLMKRWVTYSGPDGSFLLQCAEKETSGNKYGLDGNRFLSMENAPLFAGNHNIYGRIRTAQGYNSLALKHYTDTYRENFDTGFKLDRRFISGPGRVHPTFGYVAGIGNLITRSDLVSSARKPYEFCGIEAAMVELYPLECTTSTGACNLKRISPEEIFVYLDTTGTATLTVRETWYPAWHYSLDDQITASPVEISEMGFMKIDDIPAGTEKVRLFYSPRLEVLGLVLSIASFIIGAILFFILDRKEAASKKI